VPVLVSVPPAAVASLTKHVKNDRADITLLARVRDAEGRVVDAMSRRLVVDPRRSGELLLVRDAWLSPGRYRLEAVAFEAGSRRAGVATAEIEVRDGANALDRPQLLIVRRAVTAQEARLDVEPGHPLRFGDTLLLPLAGERLERTPQRPLVVQLAAASASPGPGVAHVEVVQAGRSLARLALRWPPPTEAGGMRRHVVEVPFKAEAPGKYEVRVTLAESVAPRVLTVPFEVTER
jgi:hypothetical protein